MLHKAKAAKLPVPLLYPLLLLTLALPLSGQKIAILAPDGTAASQGFAQRLSEELSQTFTVLDLDLARSAHASTASETPFNLTAEESKRLGSAIGCDFFILTRSAIQPRSSFQKPQYYEAHAAIFLVSTRTGHLVLWSLPTFEESTSRAAAKALDRSVSPIVDKIASSVRSTIKDETSERPETFIEALPDETSPAPKNFREPIPYLRMKPEYTLLAALHEVAATVDILVDVGASGAILRTRIARWAGYGLDESVERTVRAMNWRPAERNGKPVPMRFLLRYNFKKLDKDKE